MQIEAEQRRVPRLTPGDRRRYLRTRIIAIEGEADRLAARLEVLRRDLYVLQRNDGKSWSDPVVIGLVEEIEPSDKRLHELYTELRQLKQQQYEIEVRR